MEILNAKIESTMLGFEDHGILTAFIHVNYGSSEQGFGGYGLGGPDAMRVFIENVLQVVGVDQWESLKGKYIRVKREEGWNGVIVSIGNVLEDKWFNPKEIFEKNI